MGPYVQTLLMHTLSEKLKSQISCIKIGGIYGGILPAANQVLATLSVVWTTGERNL